MMFQPAIFDIFEYQRVAQIYRTSLSCFTNRKLLMILMILETQCESAQKIGIGNILWFFQPFKCLDLFESSKQKQKARSYWNSQESISASSRIFHQDPIALLVGGLNTSEKYQSIWMIIPNIWKNESHVPNHQPGFMFSFVCSSLHFPPQKKTVWVTVSLQRKRTIPQYLDPQRRRL